MERLNLTMAIGEDSVATKEAFDEQAALPGPIALTYDVLVGPGVYRDRQAQDGAPFVLCEIGDAFEFSDEPV